MAVEAVKAAVSNAATTGIYSAYDKYLIGGIIALSIFLILVSGFNQKLERWFQKRVRGKKDYDDEVSSTDADGIIRSPRETSTIRTNKRQPVEKVEAPKPVTSRRRAKKEELVEVPTPPAKPPRTRKPKPVVEPQAPVEPAPPEPAPKRRPARKKPAA